MDKQKIKTTYLFSNEEIVVEVPYCYYSLKDINGYELATRPFIEQFIITCSDSKKETFCVFPLKYVDEENGYIIEFTPEKEDARYAIDYFENLKKEYGDTFDIHLRITNDYEEFVEKIRIIDKNYSDIGMEFYKIILYQDNKFDNPIIGINYVIEDGKEFIRFTDCDNKFKYIPFDKKEFLKYDYYARTLKISKRLDNYMVNKNLAFKLMQDENAEPLHYEYLKEDKK